MPAALFTLLQTSILQQEKLGLDRSDVRVDGAGAGKEVPPSTAAKDHAGIIAAGDLTPGSALAPKTRGGRGADFAGLLNELVKVVQELSHMDSLLIQANKTTPKDKEAQKWHEVSIRALAWSRDALAERQSALLAKLRTSVEGPHVPTAAGSCEPEAEYSPTAAGSCDPEAESCATGSCEPEAERSPTAQEDAPSRGQPVDAAAFVGSLRADLEKLRTLDPACCLLIRKIKRLGLNSQERLRSHFERYGPVQEVLVAHTFEKPSAKRRHGRVRPAAMGFVVLGDQSSTQAALEASETQLVADGDEFVEVHVSRFDPNAVNAGQALDGEA